MHANTLQALAAVYTCQRPTRTSGTSRVERILHTWGKVSTRGIRKKQLNLSSTDCTMKSRMPSKICSPTAQQCDKFDVMLV